MFMGVLFCLLVISNVEAQQVQVTVSISPQKYFVERIGGENVRVMVMVPPGYSSHTFEPKPRQMVELLHSLVYFTIGDTFEKSIIERIRDVNSKIMIVRTEEGIEKIPAAVRPLDEEHHVEAEEEHHEHSHGSLDPHIWLSPPLVMIQARHIMNALVKVDPGRKDQYIRNYTAFISELTALDAELTTLFSESKEKTAFIVFHPAWGYFARTYGLRQIPVEIEGKEPKPAELMRLIDFARDNGIKVVFVQPQIQPASAEMLAREIGGQVVAVDPLAENWLHNLRIVAEKFKNVLR